MIEIILDTVLLEKESEELRVYLKTGMDFWKSIFIIEN